MRCHMMSYSHMTQKKRYYINSPPFQVELAEGCSSGMGNKYHYDS